MSTLRPRRPKPMAAEILAMVSATVRVAAIDVGEPENIGWYIDGKRPAKGNSLDSCVEGLAEALRRSPVCLGFEAPMFVPRRADWKMLTKARSGESGRGLRSRPFSAS